MPTIYDEVLYPNSPFAQTHPDRLATLAILFGMDPAPLPRCRVLEIGCGNGENLIPMAFQYPAAEFLGIDAAGIAIDAGNQEIATLGLANLRLQHRDIMDAGPELGTFDYVIAHGFYSWVPEPVRDKMLAIVQASLAPQGVAFVSYNALPGGRLRQMFREMMLFHAGGATELDTRIHLGREIVQWFMACQAGLTGHKPLHDLAPQVDPGVEFGGAARVKQHHLAKHLAKAATGKCVVADKGDALRRQAGLDDGQHLVAHGFGHPGIEAVGDHVVESPQFRSGIHDVPVLEAEIGEAQGGDFLVAGVDGDARRVDAQKLGGGVLERHRDEVLAVAAADLQDAAARERGWVHAEENGQGSEPVGMGLREW